MGWVSEGVKKGALSAVVATVLKPVVALPIAAALLLAGETWTQLLDVPLWVRVAVGATLAFVALWAVWRFYLTRPSHHGAMTARYWDLLRWPTRRVSWELANYLGVSGSPASATTVHTFQARLRLNFRSGRIEEAYITSCSTGHRACLVFDPGNAGGDASAFVPAARIQEFPSGVWVRCLAPLHFPDEQSFLQKFGAFRLTIKLHGAVARHIDFTESENKAYFARWTAMLNPPAPTGLVLK